ncbi:class I SAM-dependent methyltransferase [Streptomyces sp. NPDC018057]|uniref:class I SAM-dependent methyltransferase n=1 Tax=unclassified Streptomyces TaxID=2593676 RepID=UPI00379D9E7C
MSAVPEQVSASPESAPEPAAHLGGDPVAALEAAAWALAAFTGTLRDALDAPLMDVLAADPQRTAVLESAGLVRRDGTGFTVHPSLTPADAPTARSAVEARLSGLRQAVSAAAEPGGSAGSAGSAGVAGSAGSSGPAGAAGPARGGWSAQPDEVLLNQGRASAATGRALADKVVPRLAGLGERLAMPGARMLDVGTGVAALAVVLAERFPQARVDGIDVLGRVLRLARAELATAPAAVADRITLRQQDVAGLAERDAYELVWLPAPFVSEPALEPALPRLAAALVPGGWLVAGTNPAAEEPLRRSVGRWVAVRNGGNSYDTAAMAAALEAVGLGETRTFPTVPGGPVLVAARRLAV